MEQHIVKTTLFGVSLSLKVDTDPEQFSRVIDSIEEKGQYVRRHMLESDPHRISVLTNLLLADELLAARRQSGGQDQDKDVSQQVDQLAQELIQLINNKIED